jgi:hypothetical protein
MNRAMFVALLGVFLLFPALLLAQTQAPTIRGTVKQVSHPGGSETHVWLESAGKTQEVCLGDLRFLDENGFAPKYGDVIEVAGGFDGSVFVADSVSAGGRTLDLQGIGTGRGSSSYHSGHHCCDHHQGDDHHHCGQGDHHDGHE